MTEPEVMTAALALGDELVAGPLAEAARQAELSQIINGLKFDECPDRRRELRRRFLDLTD